MVPLEVDHSVAFWRSSMVSSTDVTGDAEFTFDALAVFDYIIHHLHVFPAFIRLCDRNIMLSTERLILTPRSDRLTEVTDGSLGSKKGCR